LATADVIAISGLSENVAIIVGDNEINYTPPPSLYMDYPPIVHSFPYDNCGYRYGYGYGYDYQSPRYCAM
jgi:hypothetical protein